MRKILTLAVVIFLSIGIVCSCTPKKEQASTAEVTAAYEHFVADFAKSGEKVYYLIKDIDGDRTDELVIREVEIISVYTYDDEVVLLDSKAAATGNVGTTRFFSSEDQTYPGIFLAGTGGGLERYNYLTLKDGKISIEKLWDEDFSDSFDDRERIVEYCEDKNLISESKKLYQEEKDIVWSELEKPN